MLALVWRFYGGFDINIYLVV